MWVYVPIPYAQKYRPYLSQFIRLRAGGKCKNGRHELSATDPSALFSQQSSHSTGYLLSIKDRNNLTGRVRLIDSFYSSISF